MPRRDGLPEPVDRVDFYLLAILDELRATRKGGPTHLDQPSGGSKEVRVKEPAKENRK